MHVLAFVPLGPSSFNMYCLWLFRLYAGIYTFVLLTAILCHQSGMTPLHRAAHQGNSEVVKALIKAESKVDEKDKASII